MTTILLTFLGSPGGSGTLYMLRHNPDRHPVRIIGVDADPEAASRFAVDKFFVVPRYESPDYIPRLLEICAQENVELIMAHHETDALLLSKNASEFSAKVLLSKHDVIKRACDKVELLKRFGGAKYEVVDQAEELQQKAEALGYPEHPLVIKPALMWGARGFRLLTERLPDPATFFSERASIPQITLAQLQAVMQRVESPPRLLLMEFLPGREYSVDAFRGSSSSIAVPRYRKRVLGGVALEAVIEERSDLAEMTLQLGETLDLRFVYGVQFKLTAEGKPQLLECNPRIQGTCVATLFSGVNLVWLAVQEALDLPLTPFPKRLQQATFRRDWGGVAHGSDWHVQIC